jgi:hypothetical protein
MSRFKIFLFIASGAAILAASFAFLGSAAAKETGIVPSPVYAVPKEPFQKEVILQFIAGKFEAFGSFEVPSRKRLVIEHVSARVALPNGQKIIEARIETLQAGGGAGASHYLITNTEGSRPGVGDYFSASQCARLYAIGNVRFGFFRTDISSIGQVNASVSGYLVDY